MTVLDYIDETNPPDVRKLLLTAHHFLLESLPPFVTCAIKWRLPFYMLYRNFCYLNRHPDHITLGFPQGWKLAPIPGVLLDENGTLKQIRYLEIRSVEDLFSDVTMQILQEAIILDEMLGKSRAKRRVK